MKLIMEGWRNYINELDLTDPTIAMMASGTSAEDTARRAKSVKDVLVGDLPPGFVELMTSVAIDVTKLAANTSAILMDPTGQFSGYNFDTGEVRTATDDLRDAKRGYDNNPTLLGAGNLVLAGLAFIPILGGVAKVGKVIKLAKSASRAEATIQKSLKISKTLKSTRLPAALKMAAEIDKKIDQSKKAIRKLAGYQSSMTSKIVRSTKEKLLQMAKFGNAVGFEGKVFRGIRASNYVELTKQLRIPGLSQEQAARAFHLAQRRASDAGPEKWVKMELPGQGTAVLSPSRRLEDGASFSKDLDQAEIFTLHGSGYNRGDVEIVVQARAKKSNSIDVNATMSKGDVPLTRHAKEKEVLLFASDEGIEITGIFMRWRKHGRGN